MGDIGLGVEFFLITLDAVIKQDFDAADAVVECVLGAFADLVAPDDAKLVELLPLAIQRQKCADFKMAGGNVELVGDL